MNQQRRLRECDEHVWFVGQMVTFCVGIFDRRIDYVMDLAIALIKWCEKDMKRSAH